MMGQHMTGQRELTPDELAALAAERQRLTRPAGPRRRSATFQGAAASDPRRSQEGTAPSARSKSRAAPPPRATQQAQPQHFDISGAIPPDLRPQNFHELEDTKLEIIQYLVNTQGLSRGEANMVISNLEVDLMNTAS